MGSYHWFFSWNWYAHFPSFTSFSLLTVCFDQSNGPNKASTYVQSKANIVCIYFFYFKGKYWGDAQNRRKFFIEFATQKGFDPLVAENWNKVTAKDIKKQVKAKWMEEKKITNA